ncbi:MAG: hypothetical protein U1G05_02215 [Kiritimatiellia bacterium]
MTGPSAPPPDRRFKQYYGLLFAGFLLLMLAITAVIIGLLDS